MVDEEREGGDLAVQWEMQLLYHLSRGNPNLLDQHSLYLEEKACLPERFPLKMHPLAVFP